MITVRIYDNRRNREQTSGETTRETTNGEETTPTASGSGEHQVEYSSGMTVAGALEAVSYTAGNDVRVEVGSKKRNMNHALRDGDVVTVTANIRNG